MTEYQLCQRFDILYMCHMLSQRWLRKLFAKHLENAEKICHLFENSKILKIIFFLVCDLIYIAGKIYCIGIKIAELTISTTAKVGDGQGSLTMQPTSWTTFWSRNDHPWNMTLTFRLSLFRSNICCLTDACTFFMYSRWFNTHGCNSTH